MTIDGPGPSNLHITRSGSASTNFAFFGVFPDTGITITIRHLTMSGARNNGGVGGAVAMDGHGNLTIDSVLFDDNQASSGGGVFFDRGFTSIRNSTFTDNEADFGGAILGDQFTPDVGDGEIVNSTLYGNRAKEFGGGVYTNVSQIQILSSTIVNNAGNSDDSGGGGGGGTYNGASGTHLSVANTLYAGNHVGTSSPTADQCGGGHTSFGYNLLETSEVGCTGFNQTGDTVDATAAMLGALGSNGGPTPTLALQAGNFAIDHGNDVLTIGSVFPACPATDQRGFLRGGTAGRCDIGAFELNASAGGGGGGGGTTNPPVTGSTFDLKAAIKKCKKKFRHNAVKRKKCIKKAKRRAGL